MSAVYRQEDWDTTFAAGYASVDAYVAAHPGDSLDAIATATGLPYAVVYAACIAARHVIMPSASGEIHWQGQRN